MFPSKGLQPLTNNPIRTAIELLRWLAKLLNCLSRVQRHLGDVSRVKKILLQLWRQALKDEKNAIYFGTVNTFQQNIFSNSNHDSTDASSCDHIYIDKYEMTQTFVSCNLSGIFSPWNCEILFFWNCSTQTKTLLIARLLNCSRTSVSIILNTKELCIENINWNLLNKLRGCEDTSVILLLWWYQHKNIKASTRERGAGKLMAFLGLVKPRIPKRFRYRKSPIKTFVETLENPTDYVLCASWKTKEQGGLTQRREERKSQAKKLEKW